MLRLFQQSSPEAKTMPATPDKLDQSRHQPLSTISCPKIPKHEELLKINSQYKIAFDAFVKAQNIKERNSWEDKEWKDQLETLKQASIQFRLINDEIERPLREFNARLFLKPDVKVEEKKLPESLSTPSTLRTMPENFVSQLRIHL